MSILARLRKDADLRALTGPSHILFAADCDVFSHRQGQTGLACSSFAVHSRVILQVGAHCVNDGSRSRSKETTDNLRNRPHP